MDLTPDEIQLIKEHRRKQTPAWEPRTAKSYSTTEKRVAFDKLHAMALEHFNAVKENGFGHKDDDHYIYEAVMELLGKDVWDTYNKFLR